jgi:hypothetical protein
LIYHKLRVPFTENGKPARVDLGTGVLSDAGQFELRLDKGEEAAARKYDWKVTINVHGGGLIETAEALPLPAPELGYQSEIKYDFPASDPAWKAGTEKYLTGHFGEPRKYFRAELYVDPDHSGYILKYWLNNNGSRVLEHRD